MGDRLGLFNSIEIKLQGKDREIKFNRCKEYIFYYQIKI